MTLIRRLPTSFNHSTYVEKTVVDSYSTRGRVIEWRGVETSQYVSSGLVDRNKHAPLLDLDYPAALVPSSTPGHFHLYLEKEMNWKTYKRLLKELARAGIIEDNFAKMSIAHGHSSLRLPWLRK